MDDDVHLRNRGPRLRNLANRAGDELHITPLPRLGQDRVEFAIPHESGSPPTIRDMQRLWEIDERQHVVDEFLTLAVANLP